MSFKRACGYCKVSGCSEYGKGTFLLNHGNIFYCPVCRKQGHIEREKGHVRGAGSIFREVQLSYAYDSPADAYREIAIVRDDSLPRHFATYFLSTPLVKTERRALKMAEAVLANLNRYGGLFGAKDEIVRSDEIILSLDDDSETFSLKLQKLAAEWETSAEKEKESIQREAVQ